MLSSGYDINTAAQDAIVSEAIRRASEKPPEIDINGTERVHANVTDLYETFRYDFVGFALLFLHEEEGIEHGIPDFHVFGLKKMTRLGGKPVVIAWPRDHAKTTLVKIAIIWLLIYTKYRFPLYACHTNTMAANALKDIAAMMEKPSVVAIYGRPKFVQRAESLGEYLLKWQSKTIIMRAIGVGQTVRGMNVDNKRPDILALDDIENAEEGEENKLGYDGITDWYYGTLKKCLDRRGSKELQIGNYVNSKSFLGDRLADPFCDSTKLAAITKDGKALWPARWTISQLRVDLLTYIRAQKMGKWLCEMMNMPLNEVNSLITSKEIKLGPEILPDDAGILLRCITVDPAIATNLKYADRAAIAVHVYKDNQWHLADMYAKKGIGVYELYYEIIELAAKWRVSTIGVEVEAYQEALRQVCEVEAARQNLNDLVFVPLKTMKKSKHTRIAAFASMLKQELYSISPKFLYIFQDLLKYDIASKNNDDDRLDVCAYLHQMVTLYLPEMTRHVLKQDAAHMQTVANSKFTQSRKFILN